uniref:Uncharacterized protein n=1 Tax=Nelumbo nucifera TaxID=4432 RepID=A0A822ZZ14_NELNU|nr:TPA_asm: hypothetical protein HUJ06_018286 [Nelumbo nucifera]
MKETIAHSLTYMACKYERDQCVDICLQGVDLQTIFSIINE